METVRVLVLDHHPLVRKGLRTVLSEEPDLELVGEAQSAQEASQLVQELTPDVILMDLNLPDGNGLELIRAFRKISPDSAVVILTTENNEPLLFDALAAGACGYLLKDSSHRLVPLALRSVQASGCLLEKRLVKRLLRACQVPRPNENSAPARQCALSDRELAVLRLISQGSSNRAIAENLHLAEATIKKYVHSLKTKLSVSDRAQAAVVGMRLGLVE